MSDPNTNSTHTQHTRETHVERKGSGGMGALSFIVGGLVVAVGILAFVFWGGGAPDTGGSASGGDDVSISVEGGEGGEGGTAAAEGEAGSGGDSAGAAAEAEGGSGGGGSTASDSASGGGAEAEAGATAETEN